ncbi:MAG: radical SAM family heme chaperone HemW [Clostridia bacterium]|nr:radical SAM family heme chaperone HemW [Clostridia bacterium]
MELYVHIPFCRQKCRYCSFTSFVGQEAVHETYIDHILNEASYRVNEAESPLTTVYIGGGTPSVLSPSLFRKLISGLKKTYNWNTVTEFTTEANPGTVSAEWLKVAADEGVNRISFGMQTSQSHLLSTLGRIHQTDEVAESVQLSRDSGISNISLDLIFGIPGQTESDWSETLEYALSLEPCHISAYGLIPEEGTPLYRDLQSGLLRLPDPETERVMYNKAIHLLGTHGFSRYEISNFALKGYECVHNIGYWTQIPYIGLGISAASMTGLKSLPDGITYRRKTNPDSLEEYFNMVDMRKDASQDEVISKEEARFESIMLGLRMNEGVNEDDFFRKHHISLEKYMGKKLHEMEKNGLMSHENKNWKMTERGFDIQNAVLVEFMD